MFQYFFKRSLHFFKTTVTARYSPPMGRPSRDALTRRAAVGRNGRPIGVPKRILYDTLSVKLSTPTDILSGSGCGLAKTCRGHSLSSREKIGAQR